VPCCVFGWKKENWKAQICNLVVGFQMRQHVPHAIDIEGEVSHFNFFEPDHRSCRVIYETFFSGPKNVSRRRSNPDKVMKYSSVVFDPYLAQPAKESGQTFDFFVISLSLSLLFSFPPQVRARAA
jgi:hypothetical protein